MQAFYGLIANEKTWYWTNMLIFKHSSNWRDNATENKTANHPGICTTSFYHDRYWNRRHPSVALRKSHGNINRTSSKRQRAYNLNCVLLRSSETSVALSITHSQHNRFVFSEKLAITCLHLDYNLAVLANACTANAATPLLAITMCIVLCEHGNKTDAKRDILGKIEFKMNVTRALLPCCAVAKIMRLKNTPLVGEHSIDVCRSVTNDLCFTLFSSRCQNRDQL